MAECQRLNDREKSIQKRGQHKRSNKWPWLVGCKYTHKPKVKNREENPAERTKSNKAGKEERLGGEKRSSLSEEIKNTKKQNR